MTERFAGYRKLIAMLVTAAIVGLLRQFGLGIEDLAAYGFTLDEARIAVVDWILQVGLPAVIMAAQPEKMGERLAKYWRWIFAGLGVVAVLIVAAVILL